MCDSFEVFFFVFMQTKLSEQHSEQCPQSQPQT